MSVFAVGDRVNWSSQAQGHSKTKHGVIMAYVAPGDRPDPDAFADLYKGVGCGYGRNGDSYVVAVGGKHYWPIAKNLRMDSVCPTCNGSGIKP